MKWFASCTSESIPAATSVREAAQAIACDGFADQGTRRNELTEEQTMTVSLSPQHEELIREKVASGLYRSADEAIEAALRLLNARDRQIQQLRAKIQDGLEIGDGVELTPEVMDEIEREAEAAYHRGEQPDPDVCP